MLPALADLLDALPTCDVQAYDPTGELPRRCRTVATWSCRSECRCGNVEVDLVCGDHAWGVPLRQVAFRCSECGQHGPPADPVRI